MIENIQDVITTLEKICDATSDERTKNEIIDCINVIKKVLGNIGKIDDLKRNIYNAIDAIQSASRYIGDAENHLEKL